VLVLFDIDGTLVRSRPAAHQDALTRALVEVYGIEVGVGENPVQAVEPWGKTDLQIVREILRGRGLADEQIDARLGELERRATELHSAADEPDLSGEARDRTAAALGRLRDAGHKLALLTGNLEPIARHKMELSGLAEFFPPAQGAFGSDSESRQELVPIARRRAGEDGRSYPRDETLLVGDTPLDVAAAHSDGVRCIAVTGRRFDQADLEEAGADAIVDGLDVLPDVVAALAAD
jgi:phosphoglycolate phosphatase